MHGLPEVAAHVAQVVDLGVAVVAGSDAVVGFGGHDLLGLEPPVLTALFREPGLQEPAPTAAAKSIFLVLIHFYQLEARDGGKDLPRGTIFPIVSSQITGIVCMKRLLLHEDSQGFLRE